MNPIIIVGGAAVALWLMMQRQGISPEEAARRAAAQRAAQEALAREESGGSAEEWIQKGGQYVGLAATAVGIGTKVAGWLGLTGTATATVAPVGAAAAETAAIAAAEAAAIAAAESSVGVGTASIFAGAGTETAFLAAETAAVSGAETGAVAASGGASTGVIASEILVIGTVSSGLLVVAAVGAVVVAIMVSEMIEQQRVMRKRMRRLGDAHDFTARIAQPLIDSSNKTYDELLASFAEWSGSDGIQIGNALAMFARHRANNDFLQWNLVWGPKYGAIADVMDRHGFPGQALITVRDVNSVYEASADDRIPAWESFMTFLDGVFSKLEPGYADLVRNQQQPPIRVYQIVKEAELLTWAGADKVVGYSGAPTYLRAVISDMLPFWYDRTINEVAAEAARMYAMGATGGGPIDLGSASP